MPMQSQYRSLRPVPPPLEVLASCISHSLSTRLHAADRHLLGTEAVYILDQHSGVSPALIWVADVPIVADVVEVLSKAGKCLLHKLANQRLLNPIRQDPF